MTVTDQVALRPIVEDDLPFLQELISNPANTGPFMWQGFRDPREWRRRWEATSLLGDHDGTVLVGVGDHPAGFIGWSEHHWFGIPCWSLGVQIAGDLQGRGIGTVAHQLLVRYLFENTLKNRIEAYTAMENVPERRALEKSGFALEGTLHGASFHNGLWRDGVLYSITRTPTG